MRLFGYVNKVICRVIVEETDGNKKKKNKVCITASTGLLSDISHEQWLETQKLIKLSSVQGFEQIHLGVGSRKAKKTTKKLSTTKNLNNWHDAKHGKKLCAEGAIANIIHLCNVSKDVESSRRMQCSPQENSLEN